MIIAIPEIISAILKGNEHIDGSTELEHIIHLVGVLNCSSGGESIFTVMLLIAMFKNVSPLFLHCSLS